MQVGSEETDFENVPSSYGKSFGHMVELMDPSTDKTTDSYYICH